MHRPWQIWSIFAACLMAVMVAVGWLSFRALESDRRDAKAQQQAILEENARLALWRMDSMMANLVAQESARPYFVYRSFLPVEVAATKVSASTGNQKEGSTPSPLLAQPNPLISIYFQVNSDGSTASPQRPTGMECELAVPAFLSPEQYRYNGRALTQIETKVDRAKLLAELPPLEPAIPQTDFYVQNSSANLSLAPNSSGLSKDNSSQVDNSAPQIAALPPNQILPAQQQTVQEPPLSQRSIPNASAGEDDPFQEQVAQQTSLPRAQLARSQAEFQSRAKLVQGNAANFNYRVNNDFANRKQTAPVEVRMSMMKPMWLDGDLLLARRVAVGDGQLIQGAVLNWPAIKQQLQADIADLLPEADLQPAANGDETAEVRRLASLPVQLVPGHLQSMITPGLSPVQLSLLVAWIAMGLAAAAAAVLLRGVIALSERRAAFVSAVTHELRTPLTTFRMYAEMLSEGMVSEESDRRNYLQTLRREAERLTHLVANVLAYARLERGRSGGRVEVVSVQRLLEVATQRLADRAAQCNLKLDVDVAAEVLSRRVKADPSAVEQILFNLVDNACKYAVTAEDRSIQLTVTTKSSNTENGAVYLRLADHGPGISPEEQRRIFQPFRKSAKDAAHSAPGVGLGLSLSRRLARDMQGDLRYESQDHGACFVLSLPIAV